MYMELKLNNISTLYFTQGKYVPRSQIPPQMFFEAHCLSYRILAYIQSPLHSACLQSLQAEFQVLTISPINNKNTHVHRVVNDDVTKTEFVKLWNLMRHKVKRMIKNTQSQK